MTKGQLVTLNLVLLLLLVTSGLAIGNQSNMIIIPQQVQVTKLQVNLQEIAQIKGSSSFQDKIADIDLGKAPLPDYKRTIYRQQVINHLQSNQVNFSQVKLHIPYQFRVVSNYRKLSATKLLAAGKDYIYNQLPYSKQKLKLKAIDPPSEVRVPQGELEFEVENNFSRNLVGRASIPLKLIVNGQFYKRFYLQYQVQVEQKVLVSKKNLKTGQRISRDLFAIQTKTVSNPNRDFVDPSTSLSDFKLTSSLSPGEVLLNNMVKKPSLVKRWTDVTIIAEVGGVWITTTGRALQSGHQGETVKVKNKSSGKTIKGQVVGPKKVQVIVN
ncbi:flagellar basal body P-ring formation chaperone FlgA [Halanaerobaculum tunisiense]